MARTIRQEGAGGGSFAARTGASQGLREPRFDYRCTACGHHLLAAAIAPDQCPICHAGVWEYRPRAGLASSRADDPSASFATLARRVIGADSVRRWRFEQLHGAGYPVGDAFVLSGRSDIDLHRAIGLIRDRCQVATAVQILI